MTLGKRWRKTSNDGWRREGTVGRLERDGSDIRDLSSNLSSKALGDGRAEGLNRCMPHKKKARSSEARKEYVVKVKY